MSVAYSQIEARLDGPVVRLSCRLSNSSNSPWRPEEGFAVGYHLFDPESGTLIVDGPRAHPEGEVPPGGSTKVEVAIALPPEPGRYQVFLSPLIENVCWFYEHDWPFVVLDAEVSEAGAALEPPRVATRKSIARQRFRRSLRRAVTFPVLTVWRNRSLIRTMVRRDILGRYRGSFGGALWTILNPLLLMVTYFFVFGVVLRTRFAGDPSRTGFALYFLAGMLPWLAFQEAVGRAPTVMLEHRNFVKKLVFAVETLPVNLVVTGLVNELFALVLFTIGLVLSRGTLPATVLWLPVLLVPQLLFTAGMSWFLAALGVFVRDLGQVIGFVLTLWFFLTPICYPESSLPPQAVPLLAMNPMFVLVEGYRAVFLGPHAPAFAPLWKLWLLSAAVFVAGHAWFYKLRKSFPDII